MIKLKHSMNKKDTFVHLVLFLIFLSQHVLDTRKIFAFASLRNTEEYDFDPNNPKCKGITAKARSWHYWEEWLRPFSSGYKYTAKAHLMVQRIHRSSLIITSNLEPFQQTLSHALSPSSLHTLLCLLIHCHKHTSTSTWQPFSQQRLP